MKKWNTLSPEQKIERWQNVERVLKGLSKHDREQHFDMSNWGIKTACGTVACAAGHCGLDPWFIKQGFRLIPASLEKLIKNFNENKDTKVDKNTNLQKFKEIYSNINSLNDCTGNLAGEGSFTNDVSDFFGEEGTSKIFGNTESRSVNDVIKEVREYVKCLKIKFAQIRRRRRRDYTERMKQIYRVNKNVLETELKECEQEYENELSALGEE